MPLWRLRRLSSLLALMLALPVAMAWAAGANARTLVVDDDAGCRDARYASIQAAIDAAVSGDVIRVCAGTYVELVRVPVGKDRLRIVSRTPFGAIVRAPEAFDVPVVVQLAGRGTVVRGFVFSGPLPTAWCFEVDAAAVQVPSIDPEALEPPPSAAIVDNRFTDVAREGCPAGTGVLVGSSFDSVQVNFGTSVTVARNRFERYGAAGVAVLNGIAAIHDNHFTGAPRGEPAGPGPGGVDIQCCRATVRANTVEDNPAFGIRALVDYLDEFAASVRVVIVGNRVWRNGAGITTLAVNFRGDEPGSRVERNFVLGNTGHGIEDDLSSGLLIRANRSLANGGLDCVAGPFSTAQWIANVGETSRPPGLCRAP